MNDKNILTLRISQKYVQPPKYMQKKYSPNMNTNSINSNKEELNEDLTISINNSFVPQSQPNPSLINHNLLSTITSSSSAMNAHKYQQSHQRQQLITNLQNLIHTKHLQQKLQARQQMQQKIQQIYCKYKNSSTCSDDVSTKSITISSLYANDNQNENTDKRNQNRNEKSADNQSSSVSILQSKLIQFPSKKLLSNNNYISNIIPTQATSLLIANRHQIQMQRHKNSIPSLFNIPLWSWKTSDVLKWLMQYEIGKLYAQEFANNEINGYLLSTAVNINRLISMGIHVIYHQQYLLQIIHQLKQQLNYNQRMQIQMQRNIMKVKNENQNQLKININEIPYRCLYCPWISSLAVNIIEHMNKAHHISIPDSLLSSNANIDDHSQIENHLKSNSDSVSVSDLEIESKKIYIVDAISAAVAESVKDSELKPYDVGKEQCPYCVKKYSTVYYTKKHIREKHPNENVNIGEKNNEKIEVQEENATNEDKDIDMEEDDVADLNNVADEVENAEDMIIAKKRSNCLYKCGFTNCNAVLSSSLELLMHVADHET